MSRNFDKVLIFVLVIAGVAVVLLNVGFLFLKKYKRMYPGYDRKMKEIMKQDKFKADRDTKGKTLIGYRGKVPVYTPDNAKHIFVCGTTGTGKTVAIANYIKQASLNGYPTLIVDGKGDTMDTSIFEITKCLSRGKLYVINMTDPDKSDKYNPFKNASPTVCKDMLINLTDWSEEHYKINTERYLQKVITYMIMKNIQLSFCSIVHYIEETHFKELSLDLQKAGLISKDEHLTTLEFIKASKTIIEGATARFSLLMESELGTIFNDSGIDIATALDENAIILFILNPLLYPETSKLMGRLVLIDSKKAVSSLFGDERRKFFILDEMNSYISTVLIDLVNKSRSANVTCILATQSLSDLNTAVNGDFREQVIENCNNYILLRQNSAVNAEAWAGIIGTRPNVETTYQLSNESGRTAPTGMGTVHFNREYIFHPDEIKALQLGEAFYISKDNNIKIKIKVHKPF